MSLREEANEIITDKLLKVEQIVLEAAEYIEGQEKLIKNLESMNQYLAEEVKQLRREKAA